MSHPSRSNTRFRWVVALAAGACIGPFTADVASAQMADRWAADDPYDSAEVAAYLAELGAQLAERHGPLAQTMFDLHEALMVAPHTARSRPTPPLITRLEYRIAPAHLIRYQARNGGSLGELHGPAMHPIGLAWFPRSMYAQDGRVFGIWGHARLLGAVAAHMGGS